jgi:hypothetical protein
MTDLSAEAARSMFIQFGWTQFIEYVDEQIKVQESIDNVESEQALFMAKGRLEVLRAVAAYEDTIKIMEEMEEYDASNL